MAAWKNAVFKTSNNSASPKFAPLSFRKLRASRTGRCLQFWPLKEDRRPKKKEFKSIKIIKKGQLL
jgi:hypothetical protein